MNYSTESDMTNQSTTNNQQQKNHKPNWRLYAAAAGAALAFTTAADASIIYSGVQDLQFSVPAGGAFQIGGQQVLVTGVHNAGFSYFGAVFAGSGYVRLGFSRAKVFDTGAGRLADKFNSGSPIGGKIAYGLGELRRALITSYGVQRMTHGAFTPGKSGFVGFQFPNSVDGGGEGWIRVDVEADAHGVPDGLEVIDWAYNDAGGGINAGQTVAVPEPSALGLLAMGSAGVLAWRRRTSASSVEPRTPVTDVSKQQ